MAPTWIETDTNTNVNISSATAVGVYTSTGDKFVMPQLLANQVAGNGDYVYYVTLQVNGAGTHYVMGPKTTQTAAAGETAIGAQGGFIAVRAGDVVTVYIDGLAGDTATPDVTVRWFELDASANVTYWAGNPVTSDQMLTLNYLYDMIDSVFGNRYFNVIALQQMPTAIGLAAANLDTQLAAVAKTGADGDTLKTLSDQLDALPTSTTDAMLLRDWEAVTGTVPDRSTLNALRFLRNKWAASGGTLTVYKEDDETTAWEALLTTNSSSDRITGSTPE